MERLPDYELLITKAENGFILEHEYQFDDNKVKAEYTLIEGDDSCIEGEEDMFRRLLEEVADFFGLQYNKFESNNLNIKFDKKGHKLE